MATPEDIEALRSIALEEQYAAAVEERNPDWRMLDEIGRSLLPDHTPVMVHGPFAYYKDFDPKEGYVYEKSVGGSAFVGGRFGGFFSGVVEVDYEGTTMPVQRVGYFILDTEYVDTGYICPVEVSKLYDVFDTLGNDDDIFDDLQVAVCQEQIDYVELVKIVDRIGRGNSRTPLYAAYIKSVLSPIDLFSRVVTTAYILGQDGASTASLIDNEPPLGFCVTKSDRLLLLNPGNAIPELVIKKGRGQCVYIPLRSVVGYDGVSQ